MYVVFVLLFVIYNVNAIQFFFITSIFKTIYLSFNFKTKVHYLNRWIQFSIVPNLLLFYFFLDYLGTYIFVLVFFLYCLNVIFYSEGDFKTVLMYISINYFIHSLHMWSTQIIISVLLIIFINMHMLIQ